MPDQNYVALGWQPAPLVNCGWIWKEIWMKRAYLLVFAALVGSVSAAAQGTITTIAGTGTSGFSGDGGPATSAMIGGFISTLGVAVDNSGNLLITDELNN